MNATPRPERSEAFLFPWWGIAAAMPIFSAMSAILKAEDFVGH